MSTTKRTYSLVRETVEDFEATVPAGSRSAVVEEALREWLGAKRREILRREVVQGCREMSDVYREIEREYHPLEEEVLSGLDDEPPARRDRPRAARSGRRVRARR
jgi:hypothetical protein